VCDKHGSLIDLEVTPANHDDRASALPRRAELGFQGDLLGDSGYKGQPFAEAARTHDIEASVSPGGTADGRFIPNGIRWVWSTSISHGASQRSRAIRKVS
jgi:hypothetical protein